MQKTSDLFIDNDDSMKSVNNGTDSSNANDGDHGKHQQLYHLVYVVGFCVVFTAVDFVFLWPETH